jgi:Tol biopolymer transport system component
MASLDGSNTRKIADTLTSYGVSWSKDGHWIAGSANGRLLIFDLQDLGSPPRQISIAKGSAVGARWSPNGNALVLGFVRTGTATREIYTVNADGTNPVPLSDPLHLDEYPDWAPSP